jgi:L-fucose isomerase-like protein
MGCRDMNLYATLCDGVALKKTLGVEIEYFEMLDMVQRAERVAAADVATVVEKVKRVWKFEKPAEPQTLEKSARYFLALKSLIAERRYDAVSLNDVDGMKKLLQLPPAMIFMLIADELGLPTIPENDSLGSVTQLIVRGLSGQAAAYFEFYEFMEDRVLMGVPDYVPAAVVDGEILVRPTRFGSFSEGVLNVSKVKTGRVTLCRHLPQNGGYALHIVTGTAVAPRAWEEAGWQQPAPQLPGLEIILDTPVEEFAGKVACQHYILSYGDLTGPLKAFCHLNQIAFI